MGSQLSNAYAVWRNLAGSLAGVLLLRGVVPYLGVAYYFFLFTQFYASHVEEEIGAGQKPRMRVEFQHDVAKPGIAVKGHVVATTGRYIFLWQPDRQQMQVTPVTALRRLVKAGALGATRRQSENPPDATSK